LIVPIPNSTARISGLSAIEGSKDAGSVLQVISLKASKTETRSVTCLALITDRNADFLGIEGPVLRALKADLVIPVPGGASSISGLGIVESTEDTSSILEVVSLEASKAETSNVTCLALITNGDTDLVSVEGPVLRASEADLIVPVPAGTAGISGLGIIEGSKDAGSVLEVVSLEASQAETSGIVSFALITNSNTDFVGVESPSIRALKADLIVPIPNSAAEISGLGIVGIREDASSILEVVSLEASKTKTVVIRSLALVTNSDTNSL